MKKEYAGVYQLENGYWGYRFVITLEGGRKKAQKRVKDENGKPYKTQKQAVKAREMALKVEHAKVMLLSEQKITRRTMGEVYKEYCEKDRSEKAYTTLKKFHFPLSANGFLFLLLDLPAQGCQFLRQIHGRLWRV